ncbi:MAG: DUF1592 domain-containing protein [Bryobacterales bacterium]|nr:DUF1592 domain-containing protein [Bryobacterales bacterium]
MGYGGLGPLGVLVFSLAASALLAQQSQAPSLEQTTLRRYCFGCHNSKLKTGGLALDDASVATHPETFEKVLRRLRARQMPPAGLPRPDDDTYRALIASFSQSLDKRAATHPDPGRPDTFRRLTRVEYRNAIRDLLALDVDVSTLLPRDDASHGFDNVTVGELSPTLLERYLGAARKISRLAVGTGIRGPGGDTVTLRPDLTQESHVEGLPFGTRGGVLLRHTFPLDAEYELVVRLARDRNEHVEGLREAHALEMLLDGTSLERFEVKPPARGQDHQAVDQHLRLRAFVAAGSHSVGVTFAGRPSLLLETERQPYEAHFNMDRHPRITPAVFSVTVNGPYNAKGPGDTASRRRIFACRPETPAAGDCAEKILGGILRRAYRRPVTAKDLAGPLRFFREALPRDGFDGAIEIALRAILVSPEFLFRVESDPPGVAPGDPYPLSPFQLASRLSFFLWSSIPDDELLASAEQGKLSEPAELERQVRRMLADTRASSLVTNFAGQWLQLRNLDAATPDMRLFADFDDNLRQAFRRETELFVEDVVRNDRSVLTFLGADYTFLNERLAKHYGIPRVHGSHFRKVALGNNRQRGGLLRQGSILTVTSYATRTSPVIRGKWVLDNILGIPPPPPPPEVPALKENNGVGKALTVRERLALHRAKPACQGCHQLMDPVGFALENYDAVGRWRQLEEAAPIDAAGGLPDGSSFDGVEGLVRALQSRPELFATTLAEKLLTYAAGRGVTYADAPAIRQVVREAETNGFRFSSFILGIVRSPSFQQRRAS